MLPPEFRFFNYRTALAICRLSFNTASLNSATIRASSPSFQPERRIEKELVATVVPLEEAMRHVPATMTSPV
jgi:hypothetical protein